MAPFMKKMSEPVKGKGLQDLREDLPSPDDWEEVLRRWSNPALIGKIAPEVIHDINNLLTGILGYAELLNMKPLPDEGIKKGLNTISFSAEKCRVLLGRIVSLSREEGGALRLGQLNDWVEEAVDLRRCAFRHQQIEIIKELSPNLPTVSADGLALQKTLLYMFFSAEEALSRRTEGRRLEIRTGLEPRVQSVSITLSANGKGVDVTALRGLLQEGDRPNWLKMENHFGLWLAGQWLKKMGGTLSLETEGGEGPVFIVRLPVKGKD